MVAVDILWQHNGIHISIIATHGVLNKWIGTEKCDKYERCFNLNVNRSAQKKRKQKKPTADNAQYIIKERDRAHWTFFCPIEISSTNFEIIFHTYTPVNFTDIKIQ